MHPSTRWFGMHNLLFLWQTFCISIITVLGLWKKCLCYRRGSNNSFRLQTERFGLSSVVIKQGCYCPIRVCNLKHNSGKIVESFSFDKELSIQTKSCMAFESREILFTGQISIGNLSDALVILYRNDGWNGILLIKQTFTRPTWWQKFI